jgi:hypothetical protein
MLEWILVELRPGGYIADHSAEAPVIGGAFSRMCLRSKQDWRFLSPRSCHRGGKCKAASIVAPARSDSGRSSTTSTSLRLMRAAHPPSSSTIPCPLEVTHRHRPSLDAACTNCGFSRNRPGFRMVGHEADLPHGNPTEKQLAEEPLGRDLPGYGGQR